MNCCWILLLLLFSGRGGCGPAVSSCTSNNNCSRRQRENGNACERRERENSCEREAVRPESRMEKDDDCDVVSTIPQPWQEYARRDAEDCQD